MSYINCGAFIDGIRPKSKKALKEALAANPASVTFDVTTAAIFLNDARDTYSGIDLPNNGDVLTVCGPDPYEKRNWWSNVSVDRTGKIKAA